MKQSALPESVTGKNLKKMNDDIKQLQKSEAQTVAVVSESITQVPKQ